MTLKKEEGDFLTRLAFKRNLTILFSSQIYKEVEKKKYDFAANEIYALELR